MQILGRKSFLREINKKDLHEKNSKKMIQFFWRALPNNNYDDNKV